MKKIIILNTSGNVGKSVIAREVFKANMNDYELVEIESQNSSHNGFNINCVTLTSYKKLAIHFIKNPKLIIDLGNTEVFPTLDYLLENDLLNKLDVFVVPLAIEQKQWEDTTVLLQTLIKDFKIDPSKIYIIPNRVNVKDLSLLKTYEEKLKTLNVNVDSKYAIKELDLFKKLGIEKKLISELIEDTDYEDLIRKANGNEDEEERLFDLMCAQKPLKQLKELALEIKNWIIPN